MQLCALPIGLGLMLAIGYLWQFLVSPSVHFSQPQEVVFLVVFVAFSFPAIIVVHELIHASVHPRLGRSDASVIGLWPSRMIFYAQYTGALSRDRFLAILVMPFLFITILPLLFAMSCSLPGQFPGFMIAWCSTWNAMFSCGDIFGIALVLWQVPRRSIVQNQGWWTFWRPTNAT